MSQSLSYHKFNIYYSTLRVPHLNLHVLATDPAIVPRGSSGRQFLTKLLVKETITAQSRIISRTKDFEKLAKCTSPSSLVGGSEDFDKTQGMT